MEQIKEYFAFISYKSEDVEWAIWVQHELEHYHLPSSFNGREDVRQDLRPVFRDIDELSAGNLPEQIKQALVNSQNLIVICSPQAATSPWVNQEVETFISLGRTDRIFPFIVEGNSPKDFFPPALLNLPKSEERLGGDVSKNGRDAAFVKVVAGMLGVGFDSLWNRYEKEKAEEERKIREQRDNLLRVQSRFLAEKANDLVDKGDSYTAKLLATKILPTPSQPEFPYTIEAEIMIRNSALFETAILKGHRQNITSAVYSHNGNYIASSSWDYYINIWDACNGRLIKTIETDSSVFNLAFSYDNRLLAAASGGNVVDIYDLRSYTPKKSLIGHTTTVSAVAFTHNGRYLASGSYDHTCRIWDLEKGTEIYTINQELGWIMSLSFSLDDNYLIINDDSYRTTIWNFEKQEVEVKFDSFSADLSPDERFVASSERGGIIRVCEFLSKKEHYSIQAHEGVIDIVNYSQDGNYFLSVSEDNTIKVWKASDGTLLHTFIGHAEKITSASFSPNGRQVISSSFDKTIRIWDLNGGVPAWSLLEEQNSSVNSLAFIPGSQNFISADNDGNVRIWNLGTNKLQRQLYKREGYADYISICPSGDIMAIAFNGSIIDVWDIKRYEKLYSIENDAIIHYFNIRTVPPPMGKHEGTITSIAFSNDGHQMITASEDKTIKKWNVNNGELMGTFIGHADYVFTASFSPDDRHVISGSRDHTIRIWDARSFELQKVLKGHVGQIVTAVYSYDGKTIVSGSADKTIKIWNASDGRVIKSLEGHTHTVLSVALSPDNRWILSASADGTAKIWDIESGLLIYTLRGHQDHINSAVFSPDGKSVITGSSDGVIRIWNIPVLKDLISHVYYRFSQRKLTQEEQRQYYLD